MVEVEEEADLEVVEEEEEGLEVEPQLVWEGSSREECQGCAPLEMVKVPVHYAKHANLHHSWYLHIQNIKMYNMKTGLTVSIIDIREYTVLNAMLVRIKTQINIK